jgi:hypothetical protein
MHVALPEALHMFKKQLVQVTAPLSLHVLVPQSEHAPVPVVALYSPASHASQSTKPVPVYPTLHTHNVLAEVDHEFAGHVKHATEPVAALYVPAKQGVHWISPPSPVNPAVHLQSDTSSLPGRDVAPVRHV